MTVRDNKDIKIEEIKKYNNKMKNRIESMTLISDNQILTKFNGITLVNEKVRYEKNKPIKINFDFIGIMLLVIAVFLIINNKGSILKLSISIILAILGAFAFLIQEYTKSDSVKKQPSKLYMAECYIYEIVKKVDRRKNCNYYAKITDIEGVFLDEEIRMKGITECNSDEMIKAQLVILEENGKYYKYIEKI